MGHNVADDEVMRCHKLGGTEEGEGILARVKMVRRHHRGVWRELVDVTCHPGHSKMDLVVVDAGWKIAYRRPRWRSTSAG